MMKFKIQNKIGARFKCVVRKNGVIQKESGWSDNLVLDVGLNRMSVGTWIDRCCVGTSNLEVNAAQTALQSFVASTTAKTPSGHTAGNQFTDAPFYMWQRTGWRFAAGVATGNLSEVCLGWGNANSWNRALIRDINGLPATITLLADETLDVYAEIRIYPQMTATGSFQLYNEDTNTYTTHNYEMLPCVTRADHSFPTGAVALASTTIAPFIIWNGDMGTSITALPTGTTLGTISSGNTPTYPTLTKAQTKVNIPLTSANGAHKSFFVGNSLGGNASGYNGYKFQINPTIAKSSSQTMSYTVELSWSRYVA